MVETMEPVLESDYAFSIRPSGTDVFRTDELGWIERTFNWTGWRRRDWPADVVVPDQLLYAFDLRETRRQLFALLRIVRGGSFDFSSMEEFAQNVSNLIGHKPSPADDDCSQMKWGHIEERLQKNSGKACTGICYTLNVVKPVAIPLAGKFPQLGWCNLKVPEYGMK